jgi:hypothetical protein
MTEEEAALLLAEALQRDLVMRLDQAGAPKLILAATLLDLALQLVRTEEGVIAAEEMVTAFTRNFFAPSIDLH